MLLKCGADSTNLQRNVTKCWPGRHPTICIMSAAYLEIIPQTALPTHYRLSLNAFKTYFTSRVKFFSTATMLVWSNCDFPSEPKSFSIKNPESSGFLDNYLPNLSFLSYIPIQYGAILGESRLQTQPTFSAIWISELAKPWSKRV